MKKTYKQMVKESKYCYRLMKIVKKYGLFDADFYRSQIGYLENESEYKLLEHYLKFGWKNYLNPCNDFNTRFYIEQNPDIAEKEMNPLVHYILFGHDEGRYPAEDYNFYREWARFESKKHSIMKGMKECLSMYHIVKSQLFRGEYYIANNDDVHYALQKRKAWQLRNSNSRLLQNIGRLLTTPVKHYVIHGIYEGRKPNATFDTEYYVNTYRDITLGGYVNPFEHYCLHGRYEGRSTREEIHESLDELTNYINSLDQGDEIETYDLCVILPFDGDTKEFFRRMQCVCDQGDYIRKIIILSSNKSEAVKLDEITEKLLNDITAEVNILVKNTDYKQIQEVFELANTEFIWFFEKNHLVDQLFTKLLLEACSKPQVTIAECRVVSEIIDSDDEVGAVKTYNHVNICYRIGKQQAESIATRESFSLSNIIFRNPSNRQWFTEKSWDLDNSYGIARFLINYSKYGFTAVIKEELCCKKEYVRNKKEITDYNTAAKLYSKYLYDLYTIYHISPYIIKQQYERARTTFLSKSGSCVDKFEQIVQIEYILNAKVTPIVMISIYAFSHGGGEIMPIRLANQLHKMGVQVYVHILEGTNTEEKVRLMLHPDITVFETKKEEELIAIIRSMGIEVINTQHQSIQTFWASVVQLCPEIMSDVNHVATSHGMYEAFEQDILEYILLKQLPGSVDAWTYVADKNLIPFKQMGVYQENKFHKITNGMERPLPGTVTRDELNIPHDAFVFCVASRALVQKGWNEAIECVISIREKVKKPVHLLLIGEGPLYEELSKRELPEYIHLLGFRDNPCDYYQISDGCILLSTYKSESTPLTIVEALMSSIPVIATNLGDIPQMLDINGQVAGEIVSLVNGKVPLEVVKDSMFRFISDDELYKKYKKNAIEKSSAFEISKIAKEYLEVYTSKKLAYHEETASVICNEIKEDNKMLFDASFGKNTRKVSVIVPNYNHAKFLKRRLDCIFNQTYQNIEVILMDDCSADDSREILADYAHRYKDKAKLLFNTKNSGGVFHQWAKGIQAATGEICWIAESDDYCDYNFIEKLIPAFDDPKVKISYAHYEFVNQDNESKEFTFENYVEKISKEKWKSSYINDTELEVNTALYKINTIPNASGALFRNPGKMQLFTNKQWLDMKICGDWVFYLYILHGGKVAYSIDTTSYFRFHDNNSSATTYNRPNYYVEHAYVAEILRKLYGVDNEKIIELYDTIKKFYEINASGLTVKFDDMFCLERILTVNKEKVE